MNRRMALAVISRLAFIERTVEQDLQEFGTKEWQHILDWLDDSGLALYFLRHLRNTHSTGIVPPQVLLRLEANFLNNQVRWQRLVEEFAGINEEFRRAGIRFAVIKGLSLIPDYCPDTRLRTPSDLDFLIEEKDLHIATWVLEKLGYRTKDRSAIEVQFWRPSARLPEKSDDPYSVSTEAMVELHFRFWQETHRISLTEPLFSLDDVIPHSWQGIEFPVLDETSAFLLQVIHVFQHITSYWVKLCWLLEIGFFMSRRSPDSDFWVKVDAKLRSSPCLTEFAAVVIGLVKKVFGCPMPSIATEWIDHLRPNSKLWLDKYAEEWIIDDHSYRRAAFFRDAKLALFLHQQYLPNRETQKEVILGQLFPWKRPDNRLLFPGDAEPLPALASRPTLSTRGRFAAERVMFHAGSTLRYLCEVPRWRYRVRHTAVSLGSGS
jgi:hypothetical protein